MHDLKPFPLPTGILVYYLKCGETDVYTGKLTSSISFGHQVIGSECVSVV